MPLRLLLLLLLLLPRLVVLLLFVLSFKPHSPVLPLPSPALLVTHSRRAQSI
jgi:hypothetical protein